MRRVIRRYLPFEAWPKDDRTRWKRACRAGIDLFDERGPAAHLAEQTRSQLQYAYGKFLDFLLALHPGLLARPPAERVDRKIIEEYVKWQPVTCGGITLSIYIYHLWLALRYICPTKDWAWLLIISKRIAAQAKKKPPKDSLVTSEILCRVGIDLMNRIIIKTKREGNISITDAMHFRNGLIIMFLALVPLRRRTLAALRIGKHLVRASDSWTLDIPPEDVKTKRPEEHAISAELSAYIDLYLNQFRPRIPGAGRHDYLWASNRGRPMRHGIIYVTVRQCTRRALGFPVNLHRFRSAAGTFWSIRDPANVRGVKDLLGHASFATTERHYIMAQSRVAGRALARAIGNVLKRPAAS